MSTETTDITLGHEPGIITIQADGKLVGSFDWEPKASIAVEFLHELDSSISLWESLEREGNPLRFDAESRDLLENVRVLLDRLLWADAERVKVYRCNPPQRASNGEVAWVIRRYRDGAIMGHRQETIHAFAARCRPPYLNDPHPTPSTPDLEPKAWAEWFERNAGAIETARVADYNPGLWGPYDWSAVDAQYLPFIAGDMVKLHTQWGAVDPEGKDGYALGA